MSTAALISPEILKSENRKYYEFINLGLFLAVLTGIEIVIIFFPWNPFLIFWILAILSAIKFGCVVAWFMHLIYDRLLLTLLLLTGLIIAGGTMAALLALFNSAEVDTAAIALGTLSLPGF